MEKREYRDGDIIRWRWKDDVVNTRFGGQGQASIYWCTSQIAVFEDGFFYDTFWSSKSSAKSFSVSTVDEKLDIEYIGNFDDLERTDPSARAYYLDKDCIDLSHSNSMSRLFYIRKGAKKSEEKMARIIKRNIKMKRATITGLELSIKRLRDDLENLSDETYIPPNEEISLFDSSYYDE